MSYSIKIAYLILAHTDPQQLKNLVQSLYVENRTAFFIHIDAKSNQLIFEHILADLPKVEYHFIKERVKIYWGGYSICKAEENLMKAVLKSERWFSHFVLLSGLDYPVWSNSKIFFQLTQFPKREWMSVYNLSLIRKPKKVPMRITSYHFRDIPLNNPILRHYIVGGLMLLMNLLPIKKRRLLKIGGVYCPIYGGSQWWILTRECVEHVICMLKTDKSIKRYFRYSFAPDELMLQTIIANSSFRKRMICCIEDGIYPGLEKMTFTHYIKYDKSGQKIFTASDYKTIKESDKIFFRKVFSDKSSTLIRMINEFRCDS